MGESETHQRPTTTSSRLGIRGGIGEIVEVQGGHIVRSTGRKDRHSKVCTAKGPRDRRVRLSAHTAIQFYDVQDRLGYDRPSKAVDWLIKKAKAAIDELAELPAWNPNTSAIYTNSQQMSEDNEAENSIGVHRPPVDAIGSGSSAAAAGARVSDSSARNLQQQQQQQQFEENPNGSSSFLPPSLDNDIADTIKSFFPMGAAAAEAVSPSIQFQNYPPDLLSRTSSSSQNQDLRLSLQSLQDPILLHQAQHHHHHQAQAHHHNEQVLFSGTNPLGFDATSTAWSDHHPEEHGRLLRMVAWNAAAGADTGNNSGHGGGGFIFNSPSPANLQFPPTPLFGHSQYLSQRGPLQSSNNSSIRAWIDPSSIATTTATTIADHHYHHYLPATLHHHHQSSSSPLSGIGFASGGFSGFRIPARIQGEEEHDGVSDKPSSASSDSRH